MASKFIRLVGKIDTELAQVIETLNDWLDVNNIGTGTIGNLLIVRDHEISSEQAIKYHLRSKVLYDLPSNTVDKSADDVVVVAAPIDKTIAVEEPSVQLPQPPQPLPSSLQTTKHKRMHSIGLRTDFTGPVETDAYKIPTATNMTFWKGCPLSKEDLEELYVKDKNTTYEIAQFVLDMFKDNVPKPTLSGATVGNWLRAYNIHLRTKSEASSQGYVKRHTTKAPNIKLTESQIQKLSDMTYSNGKYISPSEESTDLGDDDLQL